MTVVVTVSSAAWPQAHVGSLFSVGVTPWTVLRVATLILVAAAAAVFRKRNILVEVGAVGRLRLNW